jgi:hypothetical protein
MVSHIEGRTETGDVCDKPKVGRGHDAGGSYGKRSFIICTLRQTDFQLNQDEMVGACTVQGRQEECI